METVRKLLAPLVADKRVGPVHVCMWLAIWQCAEQGRSPETCARMRREETDGWIRIRRVELMRLAKMEGKTTYYRVMGDLAQWGFIEYRPSRCKRGASRVRLKGDVYLV